MTARFTLETLTSEHERTGFSSGVEALDKYFREQVGQDVRRRVTACYVATEITTSRVAGYYTLAAGSIPVADVPEQLVKRLPRYQTVPVARLGRLAVHLDYRSQKLGGALLWDAMMRAIRSEVAVFALVVDAKDDQAVSFYHHHGFVKFGSLSNQLILALTNRVIGA
ncbi:MAG: GNAT family N-acetyltransferase [Methylicorpusculum sp.]|uniref:GNAT family N-acetyltransferase n=2 Tax=Methylicorpusculum sp. TaxID=2713644 RepID=UPI002732160C|nr:GNAT family N-acetyltransferase [Methylicorpusculum sp.]MDP2201118.1 GNAT family N-acetyltransferase [Methylicorpusculum sp.]MDP3530871.1 GNAT family N-acetyltransferase [Methylicorpusculum sp.]MDZ4149699.1 GNAT family N-acetyltransferase [Methylicorpusculum sp.]